MNFLAKLFVLLSFFTVSVVANEGHRLGGDIYGDDNTLKAFGQLLSKRLDSKGFAYAEYDIRESSDGYLVSYHDPLLGGQKIKDLSLAEIRQLKPDVATVAEIYEFAVEHGLPRTKALVGDIKHLQSDKARSELIRLANKHRDKVNTWFMGVPNDNEVSFTDFHRWAVMFRRNNLPMYIPGMPKSFINDQFAYMHRNELNFDYITLIEKPVSFSEEDNRIQFFDVAVPPEVPHSCLRIGVQHGYDDKGDRASRVRVLSKDGEQVICDVSPSVKGWQWIVLSDIPKAGVRIEWSDSDTHLSGEYAGNWTFVNVSLGVWKPLGN
ncbi:MAG: glycerophosphodiester phosphodiesterase family protein [Akkermansiaceae bacterium]